MDNKGYFAGPILIFSFVLLVFSFYLVIDENEDVFRYGTAVSSEVEKENRNFVKESERISNFVSLAAYNTSTNSSSVPEWEGKVREVLEEEQGSDFNFRMVERDGSVHFFFDFSRNFTDGKSVTFFSEKTRGPERLNMPFLELISESADFDVNFLDSCVEGCDLENYDQTLNSCLAELEEGKTVEFEPVFAEQPYSDGVINSSFVAYGNNSYISQNWPHRIQNGTYFSLRCN